MNKSLKVLAILGVSVICIGLLGRLTGGIQLYTNSTPSNEPNLKLNTLFFASNLKQPKRGDMVVYNSRATDSLASLAQNAEETGSNFIHRLCAIENDVIVMKNKILYVNGKNADAKLNLYHFYEISSSQIDVLAITDKDREIGNVMPLNDSVTLVNITSQKISNLRSDIPVKPYFMNPATTEGVFNWHPDIPAWTIDNFGPIKVPPGHGFVIGDNRHNTLDSRYTGFISLKDIKGVKL